MKTLVEEKFLDFYEKWVTQLEEYLHLLLKLSKEHSNDNNKSDFEALVSKLTAHHKEFYTSKWAAAHEDVLAFFSPVWLSPLENAYLWITGWKPSMAFRVLDSLRQTRLSGSGIPEMDEEQWKKVEELRVKIKMEEEKVEREMERQQVMMADRRMVELARLTSRVKDGCDSAVTQVDGLVEGAVKGLLGGLERVMKMGDCVRLKTLKGVLEVLNPKQCVEFLAAATMVEIQLRKWGKKRDNHNYEKCATFLAV